MSPQTSMSILVTLCSCLLVPCIANDDAFIRFYTDAGSIVEIENRALESGNQFPALAGSASNANNQGLAQEHRIETRAAKQRFCGELLVNALALVCKGNYKKRTQLTPLSAEIDYPLNYQSKEHYNFEGAEGHQMNEGYANWPEFFEILKNANNVYRVAPSGVGSQGNGGSVSSNSNELQKAAANAAGRAKLRPKRGVVDECCKKPCTTNTLQQYCSL